MLLSCNFILDKSGIFFIISVSATIVIGSLYWHYDNKPIAEEDLVLSVSFIQNITKIESGKVILDFTKERMQFKSKFYPEGNGIMLASNSRGFEDDSFCSDDLSLQLKNGTGYAATWHDEIPFSFYKYGEVEFILLTKSCEFSRKIVPNGEFTVLLYGENKKDGAKIEQLQFETVFDSKHYDCRNDCVVAKDFDYSDNINTERNERIITLENTGADTKRIEFDLRTEDLELQRWTNILFTMFPVGIAVTISTLIHYSSTKQQGLMKQIIIESHKEKQRRKKYASKTITDSTNLLKENFIKFRQVIKENDEDLFRISNSIEAEMDFSYLKQAIDTQIKILSEIHIAYSDVVPNEIFSHIQSIKSQLEKIDWNLREYKNTEDDYNAVLEFIEKIHSSLKK